MNPYKTIATLSIAAFLLFFAGVQPQTAHAQNAQGECQTPAFQITSDKEVRALTGESFSYYIVTQNSDTAFELDSRLPEGIQYVDDQLSGTPQSAGTYEVDFSATNDCGTSTQTVTISVMEASSNMGSQVAQTGTGGPTAEGQAATMNSGESEESQASSTAAAGVRLDNVPETGVNADSALTISFYLLALLFISGWFVRKSYGSNGVMAQNMQLATAQSTRSQAPKQHISTSQKSKTRRKRKRVGGGMR